MSSSRPVLVQSANGNNAYLEWPKEFIDEKLSMVGLPLKSKDSILRVIAISSGESEKFDEEEISLLVNMTENLAHALTSIRETTHRKRAEELRALENQMFQVIANATDISALLNELVKIIEASLINHTCSILLLNDKESLFYNGASPSIDSEYIDAILEDQNNSLLKEVLSTKDKIIIKDLFVDTHYSKQCQFERQYNFHSCCIMPVLAADGRLIGSLSAYSEKKVELDSCTLESLERMSLIAGGAIDSLLTQNALIQNEERLNLAIRGSQDGLWDINFETEEVYWSPGWKLMLGYEDHELTPSLEIFIDLLHPKDKGVHETIINTIGENLEIEFKLQHKNGHYIDVLSRATGFRKNANGEIVRIVGTHIDITERNRVSERIRESESKFRVCMMIRHQYSLPLMRRLQFCPLINMVPII
ncbi:MAG: PAS domain-containing protein [Gammaproteobacteria bacterium]|nr:PAS domain-containing protein [Gammaproteobacteria bacterium]